MKSERLIGKQIGLFSTMTALLLLLTGCQGQGGEEAASVRLSLDLAGSQAKPAKAAQAPAPSGITSVQVEVTGSGMDPLSLSVDVTPNAETTVALDIPAGPARRFVVTAFDAEGTARFRGEATVDLEPGSSPNITINMVPLDISVPPGPTPSIQISPRTAVVAKRGEQIFSVIGANPTDVEWRVNSQAGGNPAVGSILETGTYTAPTTIPTDANIANPDTPLFGNPIPVTVTAAGRTNPPVEDSATVTVVTGQTLTFGTNQPVTKTPGFISTESSGQRSIAFYQGKVYAVWSEFVDVDERNVVLFAESTDGTSWSKPIRVSINKNEQIDPSLAVGQNGNIYVTFLNQLFSAPSVIEVAVRRPGDPAFTPQPLFVSSSRLQSQNPSIAVSPNGIVFVTWSSNQGNSGLDILLQRIDKDGKLIDSNPQNLTLKRESTNQSEPAISIGENSEVFIAWVEETNFRQNVMITASRNGTDPFFSEIQVNGTNDIINFSHGVRPSLAAGLQGSVHIAWEDNRDSRDFPFVYFDSGKIEGNRLLLQGNKRIATDSLDSDWGKRPSISRDRSAATYVAFWGSLTGFSREKVFLAKITDNQNIITFSEISDDNAVLPSQPEPAPSLAVDSAGRAFAIWTDGRRNSQGLTDVFFAEGE